MQRLMRKHLGFTLLELLVVILIIGLLTSIVAPRFFGQIGRSEVIAAKAQIDAFVKALTAYRIDVGQFPATAEGLSALYVAPPKAGDRWHGPYLNDVVPVDPWGNPYRYAFPSSRNKDFDIMSYGRDGQAGGKGEDADISN
jgi:general secretion pathway protein G